MYAIISRQSARSTHPQSRSVPRALPLPSRSTVHTPVSWNLRQYSATFSMA
jgi:hypothetical protein